MLTPVQQDNVPPWISNDAVRQQVMINHQPRVTTMMPYICVYIYTRLFDNLYVNNHVLHEYHYNNDTAVYTCEHECLCSCVCTVKPLNNGQTS